MYRLVLRLGGCGLRLCVLVLEISEPLAKLCYSVKLLLQLASRYNAIGFGIGGRTQPNRELFRLLADPATKATLMVAVVLRVIGRPNPHSWHEARTANPDPLTSCLCTLR